MHTKLSVRLCIAACLTLMSMLMTQCTVYKTIEVPLTAAAMEPYRNSKIWTVQNSNKMNFYVFVNNLGPSSVTLTLGGVQAQADHPGNQKRFTKQGKMKYNTNHFHLVPKKDSVLTGTVELPYTAFSKAETHTAATGSTIIRSVILITAIVVVVPAIVCNCPYVDVIGENSVSQAGSLFSGAMSAALERSDAMLIPRLPTSDGNVHVRISNQLPEVQNIDQLSLVELKNVPFSSLAMIGNSPVAWQNSVTPATAITGNGTDISAHLSAKDGSSYLYDEMESDVQLNRVNLQFNRTKAGNRPLLVVHAKQSAWMEAVGETFFKQFGERFPDWQDHLDKVNPDKYNQSLRDRGLSLNVYVKSAGEWKYAGSFENTGTLAGRTMALPIDPGLLTDSNVEIKLESAHGMWELDYAALASEWSDNIEVVPLKTISAVTGRSEDALPSISSDNGQYLVLAEKGTFVDLKFEAPTDPASSLMLIGNGYYRHIRSYDTKPNRKWLKEMDKSPITTHQFSRLMKQHSTLVAVHENK